MFIFLLKLCIDKYDEMYIHYVIRNTNTVVLNIENNVLWSVIENQKYSIVLSLPVCLFDYL